MCSVKDVDGCYCRLWQKALAAERLRASSHPSVSSYKCELWNNETGRNRLSTNCCLLYVAAVFVNAFVTSVNSGV